MKRYLSQDEINEQKDRRLILAKQCLPKFNKVYSNVVSCIITYTRQAEGINKTIKDSKPHVLRIDIHNSSSMVRISCMNNDCTKGYFDLSNRIQNMIHSSERFCEGELVCDGYQDAERININQCFCKLFYKIQIEYAL